MAPTKYYAWTRIHLAPEIDKETKVILNIPKVVPGDEVNPSKLGVTKEEFDALIATGVVRSKPFPTTKRYETAKQAMRRAKVEELEAIESGVFSDDPLDDIDDTVTADSNDD